MTFATTVYNLPDHIPALATIALLAVGTKGILLAILLPLRPRLIGILQGIGLALIFAAIWLPLASAFPSHVPLEKGIYAGIPVMATEVSIICWILKLQQQGYRGWLRCSFSVVFASAVAASLGCLMYYRHLHGYGFEY